MKDDVNLIIEQILIECKDTLLELHKSTNELDVDFYGHPPIDAIIKYYDGFNESEVSNGNVLKAWKIGLSEIHVIQDLNTENITKPIDRMYYKQGIFMFSIDIKEKKVIIEWQVGPRYGRGKLYKINQDENEYRILFEKDLWAS